MTGAAPPPTERRDDDGGGVFKGDVPPPLPPDDPEAWYAPDVEAQYEVHPGVVATIRRTRAGFHYGIREPILGEAGESAMRNVRAHFDDASRHRPLTREGAVERADAGFEPKYERVLDRLLDTSPATRRRVNYHALCDLRVLGELTPLALDGRIDVIDTGGAPGADETGVERDGRRLVVHTDDYAPAATDFAADFDAADGTDVVGRVSGERITIYTVEFCGFGIDVVVYRERLLGNDQFSTKYAVLEPDLLPGDEDLIEECKARIWEANVERVVEDRRAFVDERARTFLSRRLTARNTHAWVDAAVYRLTRALAEYGLAVPPVDSRFAADRLDDLVYYVLRDYVGESILTIPIRDPHLEDIEANRVGERVKVVPRTDVVGSVERVDGRVPTNLTFAEETTFVNVVTQLAASDGTELNATTPSAKVNVDPPTVDETIRCAVALPVISEDGPHVSIRKQSPEALTPIDLVDSGALSSELVTLLWLLYEHHGVVLFSGATGVGKTTLMNAHMPFIPYDDRPISIDEGSREVRLPHETGVSLTTRDHESEYKRVTMADLMTETNYLNPDVEVIAEINTPASFETFAETVNTGHGVIGTTHAEDIETLVNRVVEQGLPPYLLRELDLVVFPRYVDGDRYVGEVVELVSGDAFESVTGRCGTVEKGDSKIHWNTVAWRDTDGTFHLDYDHPQLGDDGRRLGFRAFHQLATTTDRDVEAVEAEFHRKHRYVQYLVREGVSNVTTLFEFLADLRTDEAATVERASRRLELADDREQRVEGRPEATWEDRAAADGGER